MREKELAVITKTYDLVKRSCQHTSKFPRNHRFVLGERVERRLYDLPETPVQALLRQADLMPRFRCGRPRVRGRAANVGARLFLTGSITV
jgi:hypothetical protein